MVTKEAKEERKAKPSWISRKAKLASSNGQNSKVIIDHVATDPLTRVGSDGFLYVAYKRKRNFSLWCVSKSVSEMLSCFSLLSGTEKQRSAELNGLITFAARKRGENAKASSLSPLISEPDMGLFSSTHPFK